MSNASAKAFVTIKHILSWLEHHDPKIGYSFRTEEIPLLEGIKVRTGYFRILNTLLGKSSGAIQLISKKPVVFYVDAYLPPRLLNVKTYADWRKLPVGRKRYHKEGDRQKIKKALQVPASDRLDVFIDVPCATCHGSGIQKVRREDLVREAIEARGNSRYIERDDQLA